MVDMVDGVRVIENFYNDPYDVRSLALASDFEAKGNYPGLRTEARDEEHRGYLKTFLEGILDDKITHFIGGYNTAFQFTTENDTTWVHHDDTVWAGIIYLTPNAPVESGTIICRHKRTGISMWDPNNPITDFNYSPTETNDLTKWDRILTIGNVFNRLVLYRGAYYHRSDVAGFGKDKYDGRLFQTFFFDTEN